MTLATINQMVTEARRTGDERRAEYLMSAVMGMSKAEVSELCQLQGIACGACDGKLIKVARIKNRLTAVSRAKMRTDA